MRSRQTLALFTCMLLALSGLCSAQAKPMAMQLQSTDGGMAQQGYAMQRVASSSDALQAITNWNNYVLTRSQWSIAATANSRIATADWAARSSGAPTITPQMLADAVTNLVNSKLSTMTAAQQQQLYNQMTYEVTPKGSYGPNSGCKYLTATQQADGRWTVQISSDAFSKRKAYFQQAASGMVSNYSNFYPSEAVLVLYSVAANDFGFGSAYLSQMKKAIGDMTGLDMTNRTLFGPHGYLVRRPLDVFLDQAGLDQVLNSLGF